MLLLCHAACCGDRLSFTYTILTRRSVARAAVVQAVALRSRVARLAVLGRIVAATPATLAALLSVPVQWLLRCVCCVCAGACVCTCRYAFSTTADATAAHCLLLTALGIVPCVCGCVCTCNLLRCFYTTLRCAALQVLTLRVGVVVVTRATAAGERVGAVVMHSPSSLRYAIPRCTARVHMAPHALRRRRRCCCRCCRIALSSPLVQASCSLRCCCSARRGRGCKGNG